MTVKKRFSAGGTLVEILSVLAVMSVLIAGSVAMYSTISGVKETEVVGNDLGYVRNVIEGVLVGQGASALSGSSFHQTIVESNKLPSSFRVVGVSPSYALENMWGGSVMITSFGGQDYGVYMFRVPVHDCVQLMTSAIGWDSVWVLGGVERAVPVSTPLAVADCEAGAFLGAMLFKGSVN